MTYVGKFLSGNKYLISWSRSRAEEKLLEKIDLYSRQIGVSPKGLLVSEFKSKSGSYDGRGKLYFYRI